MTYIYNKTTFSYPLYGISKKQIPLADGLLFTFLIPLDISRRQKAIHGQPANIEINFLNPPCLLYLRPVIQWPSVSVYRCCRLPTVCYINSYEGFKHKIQLKMVSEWRDCDNFEIIDHNLINKRPHQSLTLTKRN